MALNADIIKQQLHEKITEMQRKIQLLEGETTAYYESSQATIDKNRESIRRLKQENKRMRGKVAQASAGDEHVIKVAFQNRDISAYRNMSAKAALTKVEQEVFTKKKRLNALKHTSDCLQQSLEDLKMEYQRLKPEADGGAQPPDAHTQKKEEDAMKLRALENNLEKSQWKCKMAENIMISYQKLKSHLQEESLTFPIQLDSMKAEILKLREELHNMQAMNSNAQLSKEAAKAELQQQEELLCKEHKEREQIIASYRKKVEEWKAQAEEGVRRRAAMQPDELGSEAQRSTPRIAAEEKAISTFEEAFRRIKEATGVTDTQEIVARFQSQKALHQHLETLKATNEEVLQKLKEQKEDLSQHLQKIKYSGEAKLSSDHQMLEEFELQLQAQQQRCAASKERLDWLVNTLGNVRAGVEHLADKLHCITLSDDAEGRVSPDSDEFVRELLIRCEQKLQLLYEEFEGKDLDALIKEMEEDEFYVRIEGKLPSYNTRVDLHEDQSLDLFNDEEESDKDEAGIITREALKRQSQMIVDAKSKKKTWKKKDKF